MARHLFSILELLKRQGARQKSRARLSWSEKLVLAETLRDAALAMRYRKEAADRTSRTREKGKRAREHGTMLASMGMMLASKETMLASKETELRDGLGLARRAKTSRNEFTWAWS